MRKTPATAIAVICGVVAIVVPILASIQLAKRQSLDTVKSVALDYARDVIHRMDHTSEQIDSGIARMKLASAGAPCSDADIALMSEIALGSSNIKAIGRVSGERLICSSLGQHGAGLPLGPVDVVTQRGAAIRVDVELPILPATKFIVVERDGYAVITHKDTSIAATTGEDVSVATYTPDTRQIRASRNFVNPEWIHALHGQKEVTFFDGDYVVAVVESQRFISGALAAVPATYLEQRTRNIALVLVPIGIAAGITLALAILYLARLNLSMRSALRAGLRNREFFLA